jgi:hypothetical protein
MHLWKLKLLLEGHFRNANAENYAYGGLASLATPKRFIDSIIVDLCVIFWSTVWNMTLS